MIRGTTAQFRFNVPYDFDDFCVIEAVFWQRGNTGTLSAPLPIIKRLDSRVGENIRNDGFTIGSNSKEICVYLSSEETLRFSDRIKGCVQIIAYCAIRNVTIGSKPQLFTVYPAYNSGSIPNEHESAPIENGIIILDAGIIE